MPSLKTPKLSDLVKVETKVADNPSSEKKIALDKVYTEEELQQAWNEFAESRKIYQADYQLLTQPFARKDHEITIHLHNPIQETILNGIKSDLVAHLRQVLQNDLLFVTGELVEGETKQMLYTAREKFDYLLEKNPMLKELKEKLGLDTDF